MFGVSNTDFKSTPRFGIHSNQSNASATSSIFGVSSPAFPTGFTTATSNAFPSTTLGFGTNSNQSNASTTSSIFGVSSPAIPSTPFAFPSTTLGFGKYTNQSNASTTSSVFGVSSPAFPNGFTTGTSNAFPSSTLGFGTNSNQSNASTTSSIFSVSSPAFPTGFTTGTSNAFPISTPGFVKNSTNTSGFLFGTKSSTESQSATKHTTGSRVVPYSATRVADEGFKSVYIQSISAMPGYEAKSHEELRLEDNELKHNSKGDGCDTPVNIFRNPFQPLKSNNNNPFGPFVNSTTSTISTIVPSSNPFSQTSSIFTQPPLPSLPSPNPFSLPKTNPNPSPQPFVPTSTKPNPFSHVPSNGCDTPVNIFPNPFNNQFGPPINNTTSSTTSTVPSSSPFNTQPLPANNPMTPTSKKPNPFSYVPSNIFPINNTTSSTISTVPSSSPFNTQPLPANNPMTPTEKNTIPVPTFITATVGYPHINGQQQQYVQANSVGVQSTLVADPFPTRSEIDRPNTVVQHGISSLPSQVPIKLSANRSTSSLRIRHVSPRLNSLPLQQRKATPSSSERKVAFFNDGVDRPGPFLPRENPRAWVTNSLPSPHSPSDGMLGKCCEDKDLPCSSLVLDTCIQEETEHFTAISISNQTDDDDSDFVAKKHEADVFALMPKLPNGDEYYTEPSLTELATKEMNEPGSLSRVNDFVVGKSGYGSIKFLGETDVRHLDLGTIVQFKNREVIVYADEKTKPVVGEGMNKTAEVTLLNVKCMGKKTGKQYVDGAQVESYKEMLMKKGLEQGTEFVSYDPVRGEWRFRVEHF